jgi:hypothetical protein
MYELNTKLFTPFECEQRENMKKIAVERGMENLYDKKRVFVYDDNKALCFEISCATSEIMVWNVKST